MLLETVRVDPRNVIKQSINPTRNLNQQIASPFLFLFSLSHPSVIEGRAFRALFRCALFGSVAAPGHGRFLSKPRVCVLKRGKQNDVCPQIVYANPTRPDPNPVPRFQHPNESPVPLENNHSSCRLSGRMSESRRSMSRRSGLGVACALPWLWPFFPEELMAAESSRVDLRRGFTSCGNA